jgi:hypothetical protein
MKKYTLDQVKDQYIGHKGTPKREQLAPFSKSSKA